MNPRTQSLQGWTVLVLGGTGLIGSHVVRAFSARGAETRVVVRQTTRGGVLEHVPRVRFVQGDLHDIKSLRKAAEGCHILVHCAAPYATRAFEGAKQMRRARDSVLNVLDTYQSAAARRNDLDWSRPPDGLVRMVYVSSPTTIAPPKQSGRLADETDTYRKAPDWAPYFRVKQFMEREFLAAAEIEGLPVVVVNPTFVIDEFDSKPTTGQLVLAIGKRRLPVLLNGTINAVAGREVGEGIVHAALAGKPGERYILGGENMSLPDFIRRVARAAGVEPPKITLPLWIAEGIALLSEVAALATPGKPPLLPINGLHMLRRSQALDSSKARRELDWSSGSLNDAIDRAVTWFRGRGMLRS